MIVSIALGFVSGMFAALVLGAPPWAVFLVSFVVSFAYLLLERK